MWTFSWQFPFPFLFSHSLLLLLLFSSYKETVYTNKWWYVWQSSWVTEPETLEVIVVSDFFLSFIHSFFLSFVTECIVYVQGHDPLTFSFCCPFSFVCLCLFQNRHYYLVGVNKSYIIATADLWLFIDVSNLLRSLTTPLPYTFFQELCESGGDRPGLPSLIVRKVSVEVKQHGTRSLLKMNIYLFSVDADVVIWLQWVDDKKDCTLLSESKFIYAQVTLEERNQHMDIKQTKLTKKSLMQDCIFFLLFL